MSYKVLGMLKAGGLGKDMTSGVFVPYLSEMLREQYKTTYNSGVLWWQFAPLNTGDTLASTFIYVMDGAGNIFTADKREVAHHSSFLSGQPAAGAGHWNVKKGKVSRMNATSGHYQPTSDYCQQVIVELKKHGVPVDDIETEFGMSSEQCTAGLKKRAGITGLKWYQRETGVTVVTDYATGVETKDGQKIETGSHIQGQRLRLYPGDQPKWTWY